MAISTIKRSVSIATKLLASGESFSANGIKDYTIDLSEYGNAVILDIIAFNPTAGAQYINIVRTDTNKFRILSSAAQSVSFNLLIMKY